MQPDDRDAGHLWDMVEHARMAVELTQDVSFDLFSRDRVKQLARELLRPVQGLAVG